MTKLPQHEQRDHAVLGASGSKRWMSCPGSVRLAATIPEHETDTYYAAEGTAAHELAELALRNDVDPTVYIGKRIDGIPVTKEMALAVGMYCDKVKALAEGAHTEPQLEVSFTLERLNPPEDMFGTADCVVWDELTGHLHVADFKYGKGVVVEAEENTQLMYYALGAVLQLNVKPRKITVWIIQPRAPHRDGVVRDYTFDWDRLVAFRHELMVAAYRTREDDAEIVVGDWCAFCPAKAVCPAQREYAVAVIQDAFADYTEPALPEVETLTEQELDYVMAHAEMIEAWFRAVRAHIQKELEAGQALPGVSWKLIEKRANRKWVDEEQAALTLRELGIAEEDLYTSSLISPAQADQLLRREGVEIPTGIVSRKSSGYNLVHKDDPRDAVDPQQLAETLFKPEETEE